MKGRLSPVGGWVTQHKLASNFLQYWFLTVLQKTAKNEVFGDFLDLRVWKGGGGEGKGKPLSNRENIFCN